MPASGSLVVTDTVAPREGEAEGVKRVTVAPLLAKALRGLAEGESLRELYMAG